MSASLISSSIAARAVAAPARARIAHSIRDFIPTMLRCPGLIGRGAVAETLVLRIYRDAWWFCRKELDLMAMVRGAVPTPEVLYAEHKPFDGLPPFVLMRFVEGVAFHELAASMRERSWPPSVASPFPRRDGLCQGLRSRARYSRATIRCRVCRSMPDI